MFDIFSDFIGGAGESGGILDGLFNLFSHTAGNSSVLDGIGGAGDFFTAGRGVAIDDILANAGHAGLGEGFFSRLMGMAGDLFESYLEYKTWQRLGDNGGRSYGDFKSAWEHMGANGQQELRELSQAIKGHAFMLQQLRAHKGEEGMADILQQYEASGMNLPQEDVINAAYKKLAKILAPRTAADAANPELSEMAKELNNARDALKNEDFRATYATALERNPHAVTELFTEMGKTDWKNAYENVKRNGQLMLDDAKKTGARKWLSELSPSQRGILVFAAIAGVGGTVYAAAKVMEKKRKHPKEAHEASFARRVETQKETAAAVIRN